ncbi:MAG: Zn-ribbon domain-containing OB-fold protein, partial [Candidatus Binatia bacterium]
MSDAPRPRVPLKAGYYTVPDDTAAAPRLLGTRCGACGEHFFPRRAICAKCLSEATGDVELAAEGTLYSFTFVHLPLFGSTNLEHFDGYGVGQVDLPEGTRIQA